MTALIDYLSTGSSGTGMSFYGAAAQCPRKSFLDRAARSEGGSGEESEALQIGTLTHALLAYYYHSGHAGAVYAEVDTLPMGPATTEACRLFTGYEKLFPPDEFGEVIGAELLFPRAESPNDCDLLQATVGVTPFTFRIDLVVRMDAAAIERVNRKRGLALYEPGVYLVDHKTAKAKNSGDSLWYRWDPQFLAYQVGWNALHSEPAMGMIANQLVRHDKLTDKSFSSFFCPPPTPDDMMGLRNYLQFAQAQSETGTANWAACRGNYGRVCEHLTSGRCDRT